MAYYRECKVCSKYFKARPPRIRKGKVDNNKVICSDRCKAEWKAGKKEVIVCKVCGEEFTAYKSSKRRTCSGRCRGVIVAASNRRRVASPV